MCGVVRGAESSSLLCKSDMMVFQVIVSVNDADRVRFIHAVRMMVFDSIHGKITRER